MIADYLRCDSNGCIPVAGLRCIRVSPRAAHLRILGGMRGFGLVSWGREFRKTGSLPDPSPREQHDGTAYPGRRFALPWAISFCPFGADVGGGIPRAALRFALGYLLLPLWGGWMGEPRWYWLTVGLRTTAKKYRPPG
jgi:hypothetical protein